LGCAFNLSRFRKASVQFDPSAFVADPELIRALEAHATPVCCEEEQVLFRQGDAPVGLYILRSGGATLAMESPNGKSVFTMPATSGSLLGLPGLVGSQPYTLTATAHAGAEVDFVPRDKVMTLMRTDPAISLNILKVLAAEVRSARRAII
jgi:CRP-like cAMP-binding protein